jgi:hypothetical protein
VSEINIIEAIEAKEIFRSTFGRSLESWRPWLIYLKALYGLGMREDELKLFRECTGRTIIPSAPFSASIALVGRRGGKSRIAATIAAFEAMLGSHEENLNQGERGWVFCIATDKDQAKIVFSYIRAIFDQFPRFVLSTTKETIKLQNGINIAVKPCTFRASRGFTTVCVIADEMAFWRDENSANPAEEVINSILPGLVEGGRLIGITSTYSRYGYVYDEWQSNWGKDDAQTLIWRANTVTMNPTFSKAKIEKAYLRDKAVAAAEYGSTWRDDISNFIDEALFKSAVKDYAVLLPQQGIEYKAFADPSGGKNDSFTMAIAHLSPDGQVVVDRVEERFPPLNPQGVVEEFSRILKAYRISQVVSDKYSGNWSSGSWRKNGIIQIDSELSKNQIYIEAQAVFSMGRAALPNGDRLKKQFLSLERRTRSGGNDSVDAPLGMHEDLANAAAGAMVLCHRELAYRPTEAELQARLPTMKKHPQQTEQEATNEYLRDFFREKKLGVFVTKEQMRKRRFSF